MALCFLLSLIVAQYFSFLCQFELGRSVGMLLGEPTLLLLQANS